MIRSVLLENLLRFCLSSLPANIQREGGEVVWTSSDAITVNCHQNNNTGVLNPVWPIIGCWIILLDLFLVLLSALGVLADVPGLLSAHRSF